MSSTHFMKAITKQEKCRKCSRLNLINFNLQGLQSKKKESTTEASMRISGVSGLPQKTSGDSRSYSVLPQVGVTQKEHARVKYSVPNKSWPRKYTDNDAILSSDGAESGHQWHTNLSRKATKEVASCTDLSLEVSDMTWVDNGSESVAFAGSRSVGCQTVDLRNSQELCNEGVIKYPSTRKGPGIKLRLPTCEMKKQRDETPSHDNRICSVVGDRLRSDGSDDPDIQKLSLCEQTQAVHERQEVVNMFSCCQ
jgi:hypothetical protein